MVLKRLFISFYLEEGLERATHEWCWQAAAHSLLDLLRLGPLHQYDSFTQMIFLKRPFICDSREMTACSVLGLLGYSYSLVNAICLLRRWSWKGHLLVILGKWLFIVRCPRIQRSLSQYNSFTQMMVLKRLFNGDTEENSALHLHYAGLPGNRADSFTWKMVLKRSFGCYTGEDCSVCSLLGLQWDKSSWTWYDNFTSKMVLKRLFFSDTGKMLLCSANSLIRSPEGQRSLNWYGSFTWKMVWSGRLPKSDI